MTRRVFLVCALAMLLPAQQPPTEKEKKPKPQAPPPPLPGPGTNTISTFPDSGTGNYCLYTVVDSAASHA